MSSLASALERASAAWRIELHSSFDASTCSHTRDRWSPTSRKYSRMAEGTTRRWGSADKGAWSGVTARFISSISRLSW